jgi:hypothetical protein
MDVLVPATNAIGIVLQHGLSEKPLLDELEELKRWIIQQINKMYLFINIEKKQFYFLNASSITVMFVLAFNWSPCKCPR